MRVTLAELTVYDPALGSERVLRYATKGFVAGPADTPAHAHYAPRLKTPAVLRRTLFRDGATFGRSQEALGALVLLNGDGALDGLRAYGFDGRELVLKVGEDGAALSTYATRLVATMEHAAVTSEAVTIQLRDRMLELAVPFQPTKYAGDNVLPDGLEGVAGDLEGKPKPRCVGVVKNVPAVLVNSAKLIYQVHDGPVASIDAVYDRGIALGEPLFVAVDSTNGKVFTSADGEAWLESYDFAGGGLYAALAAGSLVIVAGVDGALLTSPDAATFTSRSAGFGVGELIFGLAYGAGLYVAGGYTGKISTSPDGVTWTARTSGFGTDIIQFLAFGNSLFVAVGDQGKLSTSADGVTWTARTSTFGTSLVRSAAYGAGPGLWVIVGSGGKLATSPDGITWTSRTSSFGTDDIFGVAYGNGVFVAVGTGGKTATSPDGITWTQRQLTVATALAVTYGSGRFVVVGSGATGVVATSVDGVVWALRGVSALLQNYQAVTFSTIASGATYADEAELVDDNQAPAPGTFKVWPGGGYFRIGSPPAGLITADVTEGASAADRTAGQILTRLLADPLGGALVPWSDEDIAALDAAIPAVLGFWTAEETTRAQVADLVAMSARAWWGADQAGVVRVARFVAPTGATVLSIGPSKILRLERLQPGDTGRGLPSWRTTVRYARYYVTQTTDLAAGVTDDRRAELAREWRAATATDAAVQEAHPLAPEIVEDSLLTITADAQDEADDRQALRGVSRDLFELMVPLDAETEAVDLGDEIDLTHPRFGLSGGEPCVVLGLEPDAEARTLSLTVFR